MVRARWIVATALAVVGCDKAGPTAAIVCDELVEAGVAARCREGERGKGLVAAATERVEFDLPSVPGKTGQVLRFEKRADYDATVKAFDAAAVLAGRHRYGSPSALIFVQSNAETPDEAGAKMKAVVEAL